MDGPVRSEAGIPLATSYGPADLPAADAIPSPGVFPFTRGNFPGGYRGRLWTMRQLPGFATAAETNRRSHYLLANGQTGLSVACEMPTLMGQDSRAPTSRGEVGRCGVAIDSLADMEVLFDGIPLDRVSTSMTINATAAILLCMYIAVAERRGVRPDRLDGTTQNDILKEYIARGTYIYPAAPSMRVAGHGGETRAWGGRWQTHAQRAAPSAFPEAGGSGSMARAVTARPAGATVSVRPWRWVTTGSRAARGGGRRSPPPRPV